MAKFKTILYGIGNFFLKNKAFFKRLLFGLITLLCAMVFGFLCVKLMPGDVVQKYALDLSNSMKLSKKTIDRNYNFLKENMIFG